MCVQLRSCNLSNGVEIRSRWLSGGGDVLRVKSHGKISAPVFSYINRIVDSDIPWMVLVGFQNKRFYSYAPLKSHYLKGKPKLHNLVLFS